MKNTLIKICFASLAAMLLCFQCEDDDPNRGWFYAKNRTNQPLILKLTFDGLSGPRVSGWPAVPGDSVLFQEYYFKPDFNYWLQNLLQYGENCSLEVLSEDGTLLKKWIALDKDLSGKQFFKESSWSHDERAGTSHGTPNVVTTWVFTIQPEDLTQPEPQSLY